MKITLNKDALNKSLTFLASGVPSTPIIPVEGWIRFSFSKEEKKCVISISNSKTEMTSFLKVDPPEDCEFCVPAFIMARTVANFPDGDINIETVFNEQIGYISGLILKPEGQRKKYKIGCTPVKQFANWGIDLSNPEIEFKMNMRDLHDKIKIVHANVATNDVVPALSNITFLSNNEGNLAFLSGNGHIMVKLDTDILFPKSRIVDRNLNKYLSTLIEIGECEVKITSNIFYLSYSGMTILCRMVDAKIPDYLKLFDNEPKELFSASREDLIKSMIRMGTYNDKHNKINIQSKQQSIRLYAQDENNEAEEILDIENPHEIEINVTLNHSLLKSALSGLKVDNVKIGMGITGSSIFVKPSDQDKDNQIWMFAPYGRQSTSQ